MRRPSEPGPITPPPIPAPFTFRRMVIDDLDRVMEIEKDGFAHPWSADLLRREMVHDWSTILLATEMRRGPGGLMMEVTLGFVVYWLVHDELHVLNIASAVEERRRGVGRALMEEAAAARAQGGRRPGDAGGAPLQHVGHHPLPGARVPPGRRPPQLLRRRGRGRDRDESQL